MWRWCAHGDMEVRGVTDDWIIDRKAGTATHRPTGLVLDLVRDHPIRATLYARGETMQGLVAIQVERLMREGAEAWRQAVARGSFDGPLSE